MPKTSSTIHKHLPHCCASHTASPTRQVPHSPLPPSPSPLHAPPFTLPLLLIIHLSLQVRPEPVLAQALARLVGMIARREGAYLYYNDQFKAMRQDCTVQHLNSALVVQVGVFGGWLSWMCWGRACFQQGVLCS